MVPLPESSVDVLIIGAGPAGLMAALWMSNCGIKTLLVDKRDELTLCGQADGLQCRTLEIFDSFCIGDQVWNESCHMVEICMWNPGPDGLIRRSSRMPNTLPGVSRFPYGITSSQQRIEALLQESIQRNSTVEIKRNVMPIDLVFHPTLVEDDDNYPITVELAHVEEFDPSSTRPSQGRNLTNGQTHGHDPSNTNNKNFSSHGPQKHQTADQIIYCKYVLGCDGAHSWVRKHIGIDMEGDQTDHVWGVLDIIPITNFPDIRSRCAIHSADKGTIMVIPREKKLVRIYCQLSNLESGIDGRIDRSKVTPGKILKAAQDILYPYKLEYNYCAWWTSYQIGQRVGAQFTVQDRIFLAGDAVHTHSPKAGQGMNVSMQDSYNLGWKIALVIQGIAKPSILRTYELERRTFAQELIAFDRRLSTLFSGRPAKDAVDQTGISMQDFEVYFNRQKMFAAGFAVDYRANLLNTESAITLDEGRSKESKFSRSQQMKQVYGKQRLATNVPLGQRFPSFKVVNHSDARSWHLGKFLKSDGRFRILIFAGDVSNIEQMKHLHDFAFGISNPKSVLRRCRKDIHALMDILTIHSAPRDKVELSEFPELLHPFDAQNGWAYDKILIDMKPYYGEYGQAYQNYGIDRESGCVIIVRPDQHVSWIGDLKDAQDVQNYFENIFIVEDTPA